MQIRSILVHLDPGLASVTRLTLAHGLAERLDAELTLLFGSGSEAAPPAFAYSASAALQAAEETKGRNDFARAGLRAAHGDRPGTWCDARGRSCPGAHRRGRLRRPADPGRADELLAIRAARRSAWSRR
jgi:hypothetical protein